MGFIFHPSLVIGKLQEIIQKKKKSEHKLVKDIQYTVLAYSSRRQRPDRCHQNQKNRLQPTHSS